MELRASAVVVLGCSWTILCTVPLTTVNALCVVAGGIILVYFERRSQAVHHPGLYRSDSGRASYCCILLPMAVILSMLQLSRQLSENDHEKEASPPRGCHMWILYSMFTVFSSLAVEIQDVIKSRGDTATGVPSCQPDMFRGSRGTILGLFSLVAMFFALDYILMQFIGCWELCLLGVFSLLGVALRACFLHWLPGSFSAGEATVMGQALALLVLSVLTSAFAQLSQVPVFPVYYSYSPDVILFMQTAVISCLLVTWCLYKVPICRHPLVYYPLVLGVMLFFSLPILYYFISKNFVLWILEYVTHSTSRMYLFAYWTSSSLVAGLIVLVNSRRLDALDDPDREKRTVLKSKDSTDIKSTTKHVLSGSNSDIIAEKQKVVTVARKHFHVFAVVVFVPGLLWDREMLCNGATCAMVVFVMLEGLRIPKIPPFGGMLGECFQVLVDSRDAGPVILTHMYLLAGLAMPIWLHPTPLHSDSLLPLLSGVLSLGIGDTAASVVGSKFGQHKWSGTKKTVEGTIAAILSQLLVLAVFNGFDLLNAVPWIKVILAVVMTSLLEAFTSQIDNLILPLFMYIMLV